MRIVLHGGLHKSGSTTVQGQWRAAFPGPEHWYPSFPDTGPGHHSVFWPHLSAFRDVRDADLQFARSRNAPHHPLREVLARAEAQGTQILVLSTEELDRLREDDLASLEALLGAFEVTFALTVTRPAHRWASGWQQLVKGGLAEYPADAVQHLKAYTALSHGRLRELMTLPLWSRRVVRLVRTSPHEDDLSQSLATSLGLPWFGEVDELELRNVSLGNQVEVLRRINENDLSLGLRQGRGRRQLDRLVRQHDQRIARPGLAKAYEVPEEIWRAAEDECAFLSDPQERTGVEVLDPHGLLPGWLDREPPSWYSEIAASELDIPELDQARDVSDQLWRVRQERAGLELRLQRVRRQLDDLRAEAAARDSSEGEPAPPSRPRDRVHAFARRLRG